MSRIEHRANVHDKYQFELKLDYELDLDQRSDSYRIEAFFFVPANLGVNRLSYPKDIFYQDLLSYTRYKTPVMSFEQILDSGNALSPLTRLKEFPSRWLDAHVATLNGLEQPVIYELKMLGCIVKSASRDDGEFICARLRELPAAGASGKEAAADVEHLAAAFLGNAEKLFARFREVRREYLSPKLPAAWREAFALLDEAMSVQVEQVIFKVGRALEEKSEAYPVFARLVEEARRQIAGEVEHRKGSGYPCVMDRAQDEREYEAALYRIGMLKKFCGSALYLSTSTDPAPMGLTHILYGAAAAIAMAFALLVTILFLNTVPMESVVFFVAAVAAYAFKDRIKDALKAYFNRRMSWALFDRKTLLRDHGIGDKVVGACKEAMSFIDRSAVPTEVLACRSRPEGILDADAQIEQVFKYEKDITVYPARIRKGHRRVGAINDILRFCVRHFLYKMDEPVKSMPDLGGDDLSHKLLLAKVYHVNVVFRLSHLDGGRWAAKDDKVRLILDRDGIRRIEGAEGKPTAVDRD